MENNNNYFEHKRTTSGKQTNFLDTKAAEFPGYEVRNGEKLLKEYNTLKADMDQRKQKVDEIENREGKSKSWASMYGLYSDTRKKFEEVEKALLTGSVFADQSIKDLPYLPGKLDFSIGDLVGRQRVNKNRIRIPMDHYVDNTTAQIVKEGDPGELKDLLDSLTMLVTSNQEPIIFNDIQTIRYTAYNDDKKVMEAAFDSVHKKHLVNAENKKALEILTTSKESIAISSENVQSAINANLCGKAKRDTIIITNKSGFAKLDIDINGAPQITKDQKGNMIYKHKYIVQEIPDEILPNTENGSPIVIGDIAHVLKFYVISQDNLFKNDIFPYDVGDRQVTKEIITLTTKSNEAYIVGYLA
jgi:hypothetical protein